MSDSLRPHGLQHARLPCLPEFAQTQWIFRTDFVKNWLVGSPCCPRDSQVSSLAPQFENISSSALIFISIQFSLVAQLCLTLCYPMDYSTPGFPVHHQLTKLAQTHVHRVGDAIQPSSSVVPFSSCLQSFLASGSFPMSHPFTSGGQSIGVSALASVLPMNIRDLFLLGLTGLISLESKGLSRVFFNTALQKHQLFGAQISL